MEKEIPIDVVGLMPLLDQHLLALLEGLPVAAWSKQTIAPKWQVKDVAVHLLDGNLRALSMLRDGCMEKPDTPFASYQDLIDYLNGLNADWVKATRRLSPQVIITLLKSSGAAYCTFLKSLDPYAEATFPVAWAGEKESQNWFHIAREYTEKWHHQQQIRLAVEEDDLLLKPEWFVPYLATSVRVLPYHYRSMPGGVGDVIHFTFQGVSDQFWFLQFSGKGWHLLPTSKAHPKTKVVIPARIAWRVFTKGIDQQSAIAASKITGDQRLGEWFFGALAVMA